jgi:hypothetical protein
LAAISPDFAAVAAAAATTIQLEFGITQDFEQLINFVVRNYY